MTDRAYARISLDTAQSGSISKQRARLRRFAGEEPEWYVDESVSGSKVPFAERPDGGRLLVDLQRGDRVLVTKIDRAARNVRDLLGLVEQIPHHPRVVTHPQEKDTSTVNTHPTRHDVKRTGRCGRRAVPTADQMRTRLGLAPVSDPEPGLLDRVRAEARHNTARIRAAMAGETVPGPLTSSPAVPSRPEAPETAGEARVRELLASGRWIGHNTLGVDLAERRRLSLAIFALVDSGELESRRLREPAPDGSRREYRLA